ncbi:MAG: glycerol kinase [Phycisphaerae bacterium]|nr:glycerol kinase [Phycisphaerae bacterium]
MAYILSLDQGTSSSRSIVFDHDGSIVGVDQVEFPQHFPESGWVEHDLEEIWSSQLKTIKGALEKAGITAGDLAAIGITNQRETVGIWDRKTGKPVCNAIVWQDRRTSDYMQSLKDAGHLDMIREKTGLVLDPYFSASKIRWMLQKDPGLRERAIKGELAAGTIDTWLTWKLSGGSSHVTDVTNACRTLLCNIHDTAWDSELLELFEVPAELLPEIVPSSGDISCSDESVLGAKVPITGIAGDQQAALFGQLCTSPGMFKNTYGTGCFMLANTGTEAYPSPSGLLTTIAWKIGDEPTVYALEGSVFVAGASIQWLRDGLKIIDSAPEVNDLASQVEDTDGVYMVPALAGLGAPYWDPTARGTIIGITRATTGSHVARATLEGIAFRVADIMQCMVKDANIDPKSLRVDGGAAASDLLLQIQSNLLNIPVERPSVLETTALGAAYLAGLAVGVWDSTEQMESHHQVDQEFTPDMDESTRTRKLAGWKRAIDRAKQWALEDEA